MKCMFAFSIRVVLLLCLAAVVEVGVTAQGDPLQPSIGFAKDTYAVRENQRAATISLFRSGPTNTAVAVDFATADGTAVAGTDYLAKRERVTFDAGQSETRVKLDLIDNLTVDGNKVVKLQLANPGGAALQPALSRAQLVIEDNDTQSTAWLTFGLDRVRVLHHAVFDIPLWQYLASLIFVILAYLVSKLFDAIIYSRLRTWSQKTHTQFDDLLLVLLRGPVKIVLFVVLLHIGLRIFSWPEWFSEFLGKGLKIIVAFSITYMLLKLIDLMLAHWKPRALEDDKLFRDQLLPIIRNTLKVVIAILAVLFTLQNLGLEVTSLITSLGIGGLAFALAAQDTVANLFGAVSVLLDKPFRIGDRIKVDSVDGVVEAIGLRSTRVRNLDGHLITVPNKTMGNAVVTNVTERPNIKTELNIGITYDTSTEKVKRAVAILEEIYRKHPKTADLIISFNRFADSSLNILVVHWWGSTDYRAYLAGMQELNLAVKERFDREGISFAFPTQTLYVKQDSPWRVGQEATR